MRKDIIDPRKGEGPVNVDLELLISRTKLLIKYIFGFERVEVVLYSDGKVQPEPEDWESIDVDLITGDGKLVGRISVNDLPYNAFGEEAKATLNIIAQNLADQLTDKIQIRDLSNDLERMRFDLECLHKEVSVAYDDLNLAHEELSEAANLSALLSKKLSRKELQVDSFLEQVPLAFAILSHRHLKIEVANTLILKLWGKEHSIIGKPLATALPELAGQPYLDILDDVYTSGKRYVGKEKKATLNDHGTLGDYYFDFIYEPLKNEQGNTHAIMIVATDVTELVVIRNQIALRNTR